MKQKRKLALFMILVMLCSMISAALPVSAGAAEHTITVTQSPHGYITSDRTTATVGVPITLTVKLDTEYTLQSLTYKVVSDNSIDVKTPPYVFDMPDADVTVTGIIALNTPVVKPDGSYTEGDYSYKIAGGKAEITKYQGTGADLIIPSTFGGAPVTSIGGLAFQSCTDLTSVTIPSGLTNIGYGAFSFCGGLTTVTIPNGVTSIGGLAFDGCGLTTVTIPSSVTSIGDGAFIGCGGLASVTIPSGVTSIGDGAFAECSSLTSLTVDAGNLNYKSIDNVIYSKNGFVLLACPAALTSVTIPECVTSIGASAFDGCSKLTSVTIPSGVTSIGDYAFTGCSRLASVTIPSGVTSIGSWAFSGCSGVTSVTIPSGVTSIGNCAFQSCRLNRATFLGNAPASFVKNVFDNTPSNFIIYYSITSTGFTTPTWNGYNAVPMVSAYTVTFDNNDGSATTTQQVNAGGTIGTLPTAPKRTNYTFVGWNTAANGSGTAFTGATEVNANITVYAQWTVAPDYTFDSPNGTITGYNGSGGAVVIPDHIGGVAVIGIGNNAFAGCTSLTSVTIPSSVIRVGYGAFQGCTGLTYVIAQGNITNYSDPFLGCTRLETLNYCGNTFNGMSPFQLWKYYSSKVSSITISPSITGGTIAASAPTATTDDTVTLTITPAAGKRLKAGTLQYRFNSPYPIGGSLEPSSLKTNTALHPEVQLLLPVVGNTFAMPPSNVIVTAQFEDIPSAVTYNVTYNGNGNTGGTIPTDSKTYTNTATVSVLDGSMLTKTGYTFAGWNTAADGSGTSYSTGNTFAMNGSNVTLYAKWKTVVNTGGGGGGGGSTTLPVVKPVVPVAPVVAITPEVTPLGAVKFYEPYVLGYPDGNFRPVDAVTRAQLASMFARILKLDTKTTSGTAFTDVKDTYWAYGSIQAVSKAGIFGGYADGTFKPENPVTRAEIAAVVSKYWDYVKAQTNDKAAPFTDIKGNWAEKFINKLYNAGVVTGFEGNLFKPEDVTKREQIVVMMNKIIARPVLKREKPTFADTPATYWAYSDIEAATAPEAKTQAVTQ